jgi:hypothetical protein
VTKEISEHVGRAGAVARAYWREEALWVRIRTREGTSVSVPWSWTDLPTIVLPEEASVVPLLSRQALMDLVHRIQGARSRRRKRKALSP